MLELREVIIYKAGMPQLPVNIDSIEIYSIGIDWIKVTITKGVDFEHNNLYDIGMFFKSSITNKWDLVASWEHRVTQRIEEALFVKYLSEKGKLAFSDPESIYIVGMMLEDEEEIFKRKQTIRLEKMEYYGKTIKPAFITQDRESELKLKFAEERARKIDKESKMLAVEQDFRKIKEILGEVTPQKEKEIRASLMQKYFAIVPVQPVIASSEIDVSGISIDVGSAN